MQVNGIYVSCHKLSLFVCSDLLRYLVSIPTLVAQEIPLAQVPSHRDTLTHVIRMSPL